MMDTTAEDGEAVKADDPAKVNAYLPRLVEPVVVEMAKPLRPGPSSVTRNLDFKWRDPSLRVEVADDET